MAVDAEDDEQDDDGDEPARVEYGTAHVHASRFIQELGPTAPAPQAG